MSGRRLYSYREGDRTEYLADYLLSGIGLSTPIRRQEDIGFDFYCQLGENERGNLTFGSPFIIQIKSNYKSIIYGNEKPEKWSKDSVDWLFKLDIPFFIGVVNKSKIQIEIYNTTPLWEIYHLHKDCSFIEFKFRDKDDISEVDFPNEIELVNWPKDKGDGKKYVVDLGTPVIIIKNKDTNNRVAINYIKNKLKRILEIEEENILYKKTSIKFFCMIKSFIEGGGIEIRWYYFATNNSDITPEIYKSITPGLIALAINLKVNKRNLELKKIKEVINLLPKDSISPELIEVLPDIFL